MCYFAWWTIDTRSPHTNSLPPHPLFCHVAENPVGAFGTQFLPAEPVGQHELLAGGGWRRGRGEPPPGPLPADQLAPGAAGGSYQGAEGVAARHRAPHLQLLPPTGQGRLGAAPELQGRKDCSTADALHVVIPAGSQWGNWLRFIACECNLWHMLKTSKISIMTYFLDELIC